MTKLSANLTWLFTEVPIGERFAAAASCGFRAVEMLFPYFDISAGETAAALRANALELALINLPPGDLEAGERGLAALPGEEARFDHALDMALAYAAATGCRRLHAMSGIRRAGVALEGHEAVLIANLTRAAEKCAAAGVTLLIEPLNASDNPGYVLTSIAQGLRILDAVGRDDVQLQLDLYHACITEGDVPAAVRSARGRYGHVQIAGVPGRNEPDSGLIDTAAVLAQIDADGYTGWIGAEYRPRAETKSGLGWAAPYLQSAR